MTTATISLPRNSTLVQVESHASLLYGGTWEIDAHGVWRDPDCPDNFVWLVRRKYPIYFCP